MSVVVDEENRETGIGEEGGAMGLAMADDGLGEDGELRGGDQLPEFLGEGDA